MPHDPPRDGTLDSLQQLVRRLRAPDGCPWDREQTFDTVRAYLLEEAHEAAQAIDSGSPHQLREELGDLLFQVAFLGVLAEEQRDFELADAMRSVEAKMVARHPHVFGGTSADDVPVDAQDVARRWQVRKAGELAEDASILDGVPRSLPSLVTAYRLGQKAAGVGFDWPDPGPVVAKVREELIEVEREMSATAKGVPNARLDQRRLAEELGDLLFAVANLARHLEVDPDAALARTNDKFRRRFAVVEAQLRRQGVAPGEATLVQMDELWSEAKRAERC